VGSAAAAPAGSSYLRSQSQPGLNPEEERACHTGLGAGEASGPVPEAAQYASRSSSELAWPLVANLPFRDAGQPRVSLALVREQGEHHPPRYSKTGGASPS